METAFGDLIPILTFAGSVVPELIHTDSSAGHAARAKLNELIDQAYWLHA